MNENTIFIYENAIGSITFSAQGQFWITEIDGVSSVEVDISESRSTTQVGSSIASQSVQPRSMTIDGAIFDPIQANRKTLIAIIAPQVPATLTCVQNGESWYLDVYPEHTPEISPGNGVQFFQARIMAAYPYWKSTKSYSKQIAGLIAMFRFPFYTGDSWWLSRFDDSYFATITNQGNVPIEFQVTFTARSELQAPELYHVDTRKLIRLNKTMVAGDTIVISTVYGKKGVVCKSASGVVSNGFKYLSIDSDLSMSLMPGDNLLRIGATVNREGLSVRIAAPEGVISGV